MRLLRIGFTLATPADPKESEEVSNIAAELDGMYGKGKYCPPALANADKKCLDIGDITRIMAASTNPAELLDAWKGWHAISPPMRKDFTRFVELSNKGARELGFRDTGAMWRSKYDMPPDDFAKELDRLWEQVRPLYLSLHAYVRNRLREKYGDAVVPASGPIPAYLLGNIWAQDWSNVYPLGGASRSRPRLRSDQHSAGPQDPADRYGPLRREFLQVAGVCAAADDVLGAGIGNSGGMRDTFREREERSTC